MKSYFSIVISGLDSYLVKCGDFWQYLGQAQKYAEDRIYLLDTIETWSEPWLFLITSSLQRIIWIEVWVDLLITTWAIHILTGLFIYIITSKIFGKLNGLISILIFTSIYLTNTAFVSGTTRLNLVNLFLVLYAWAWTLRSRNKIWIYVIEAIFFGAAIMAHRTGIMILILLIGLILTLDIFKKDWPSFKKTIIISTTGALLAWPYLFMQFGDILYTLTWYLDRITKVTPEWSYFQQKSKIEDSQWFSLFSYSQTTTELPFLHYLKYQSFILFILISKIKRVISKIGNKNISYLLIILITYISTKLFFSVRLLATFEIFAIIAITWTIYLQKNKIFKIIIIMFILTLWILSLSPKTILSSKTVEIRNDPSISFIKNNINPIKSYLIGWFCISDVGVQMGYITANNWINAPLWRGSDTYKNQEEGLQYYTMVLISTTLSESLATKPYVHEVLKWKDIYILIGPWTSKEEIWKYKMRNKNHFKSPYMDLIYENTSNDSYIKYIFKVKGETLNYFDTTDYLHQTLTGKA